MYFDNAATSWPKPWEVIGKVNDALLKAGNPGRGTHEAARWSADIIYRTRERLSELFGLKNPLCIGFSENATGALNFAINQIRGPVITTAMEHNSVLRPCFAKGNVITVPADEKGNLDMDYFISIINSEKCPVIMTHASNVTGNLYDIGEVGRCCRKNNVLFIVDAAQTAGVVPIDMNDMNIDILCFTGHKGLLGPQGTGGIAVREGLELIPFKMGGTGTRSREFTHPKDMPDVAEAGTLNTHGIAGLLAGVEFVKSYGVDKIYRHEKYLAELFEDGIKNIKGIKIYGDLSKDHVGIVSFNIEDVDSSETGAFLAERDVAVRSGFHCAPLAHKAIGTENTGAVRFSFGIMNSAEEVYSAIKIIKEMMVSAEMCTK